jgi:hypothetical protein
MTISSSMSHPIPMTPAPQPYTTSSPSPPLPSTAAGPSRSTADRPKDTSPTGYRSLPNSTADGSLAIFCPACPQPGINLPSDWKDSPQQWIFTRGYCMDGNFSAEHLHMRHPSDEVILTDGTGFFVAEKRYKDHLKVAIESREVSDSMDNCANPG